MIVKNAISYARRYTEQLFKTSPNRFIERLREQSFIVCLGTQALKDYMDEPNRKNQARLYHLEHKADDARYRLVHELNNTFVTPIDREDLFILSRAIDDVMDFAYSIIVEMATLNIVPNQNLREMANLLHQGAVDIREAILHLGDDPEEATTHTLNVRAVESKMEKLYASALSDLFDTPNSFEGVVDIMKLREIYRHMFRAVRSAKHAGDIIGDILIKFY